LSDCVHAGKLFGGCNFEARYDSFPIANEEQTIYVYALPIADRINAVVERVYVRDVCTRCGRTIERSSCSGRSEPKGETK
jgi:hypothetical protein